MQHRWIGLGIGAIALAVSPLPAEVPELEEGVYVQVGGSPMSVDRHSTPEVVDWNNDGKKDILVGQFGLGKVNLFLNQGEDTDPLFTGGSFVHAGGSEIRVPYG